MASEANPQLLAARPLRDSLYGELIWSRPGLFRRELLLESGSEILASLRWEKVLSDEAIAESADGRWNIGTRRGSSLRREVQVRELQAQEPMATFKRSWRRTGDLRFASGPEFAWKREGFWWSEWFWSSARTERLVTFRSRLGFRTRLEMEVDQAVRQLDQLPILVLLGAYLVSLMARESAAH